MTKEEFELMPRRLGWRHEYYDGKAHITPNNEVAVVSIEPTERSGSCTAHIRPWNEDDRMQLISAYVDAFTDTIECSDMSDAQVKDWAARDLEDFSEGRYGEPLPVSRVAVSGGQRARSTCILGAVLLRRGNVERTVVNELTFVRRQWQREGIGTALMSTTLTKLCRTDFKRLYSTYALGNEAAACWARAFGFKEEPDLNVAKRRLRYRKHELWRCEELGACEGKRRERLEKEIEQAKDEVERLEQKREQEGFEAVAPLLRIM